MSGARTDGRRARRIGPLAAVSVLAVLAVLALAVWMDRQAREVRETARARGEAMRRIDARILRDRPGARILHRAVESRCGRVIYVVERVDAKGRTWRHRFDIATGEPLRDAWVAACLRTSAARSR